MLADKFPLFSIEAADNFNNKGTANFTLVYNTSAPEVVLDVPEHPGLTYFTAWTERYPEDVTAVANDPVEVTSFEARLVNAVDNDQDGDVDKDDCNTEDTSITLAADAHRLELANNGKAFCIRATDIFGNLSAWSIGIPGFKTVATLTYGFGGVSVVERVGASNSETVYVVGDHLGSASMAFEADGTVVADVRYLPFGEERWEEVDLPNDRGFTGQRGEKGFGLVDFNARFYSPFFGRFISPDSIVPDPDNVLDWDRYSYSGNNPINYNDPSGHAQALPENIGGCGFDSSCRNDARQDYLFSLVFEGSGNDGLWSTKDWDYYYKNEDALWENRTPWLKPDEPGWDTFATHVQRLAKHYTGDRQWQFVKDVGLLFAGIRSDVHWEVAAQEVAGGHTLRFLKEGNQGLQGKYIDTLTPLDNQSHHYAGLFYLGYFAGETIGVGVNIGRDTIDPSPLKIAYNPGDIELGNIAAHHGSQLGLSNPPVVDISQWISALAQ